MCVCPSGRRAPKELGISWSVSVFPRLGADATWDESQDRSRAPVGVETVSVSSPVMMAKTSLFI